MTAVLVVRHCATSGQEPDAPLTEAGCRQALELADRLSALPVDRVVSSPYARAVATIEPFARRSGLAIERDERLAERRISPQPVAHWRELVRRAFDDPDFALPGGESGREALARGLAVLHELLDGPHRLPAAVTHGHLLALVLHSIDPGFGFAGWSGLRNPDLFRLERDERGRLSFARP